MAFRTVNVSVTMRRALNSIKHNAAVSMRQGISPRRLALTLALGFAIGCIPVLGIPTVICAALALALRLNLPAIQAANYLVMPLQLALIVPFVRFGDWLFSAPPRQILHAAVLHSPMAAGLLPQIGALTGHALMAWLIFAGPAVALMTVTLTLMLRRIPALTTASSGN